MDKLNQIKLEVEEERRKLYLEKYGELSEMKSVDKITKINDFN